MNNKNNDYENALKIITECCKKRPMYCCCYPNNGNKKDEINKDEQSDEGIKAETISVGKTVTGKPGSDALVTDTTGGPNHVLDFVIPEGVPGKNPDSYPYSIKSAYLVTFSNNKKEGIEVLENGRIPITREELDTGEICEVDLQENTFQFNKPGYYRITFKVHATLDESVDSYVEDSSFISLGIRLVGTDDIFIGDSHWIHPENTETIIGDGIITVNSIVNPYELVNLSKQKIFLKNPDIANINTKSYFSNAPVTIVIQYLGNHIIK